MCVCVCEGRVVSRCMYMLRFMRVEGMHKVCRKGEKKRITRRKEEGHNVLILLVLVKVYVPKTLEESLSITTGRCDLAIATHARKMHKKISI